jgi:hypothetical protein
MQAALLLPLIPVTVQEVPTLLSLESVPFLTYPRRMIKVRSGNTRKLRERKLSKCPRVEVPPHPMTVMYLRRKGLELLQGTWRTRKRCWIS